MRSIKGVSEASIAPNTMTDFSTQAPFWNHGSQYPPGAPADLTELKRTDMQLDEGYWIRVSDDGGRTWGSRRWSVPVRRTRIDHDNPWGGTTMGMFLCDKPSVIDGAVYMAFQKTREGAGETPGSEVFFLRSRDVLHVDDLDDAALLPAYGGKMGVDATRKWPSEGFTREWPKRLTTTKAAEQKAVSILKTLARR